MRSENMLPTLRPNDQLAIREGDVERGDLVLFEMPPAAERKCGGGGLSVARVIAIAGDTWEQRDGDVVLNGIRIPEPYAAGGELSTYPQRIIDERLYFVMGDNRASSCDSREWGAVPEESIAGRVAEVVRGEQRFSP